jgi:hypothetical protein
MAGGSGQSQTQTTEPPSWAKPYLVGSGGHVGVLPTAEQQFLSSKPSYFPGSTVAGFAPEQVQGMEMGSNRATMGSPLNAASGAETLKTLGGDYLGQENPYLDSIRQRGLVDASKAAGQFAGYGRSGSPLMQGTVAEAYTNATAPYFFNAYENERGRIGDAAHFAPTLAAEDYRDIDYLRGIGNQRQQQGQSELTDEVNRWNFDQTIDQQKLQQYNDLIRGATSGYGVVGQSTPGPGAAQQGLGALAGLASTAATVAPKFASSQTLKENLQPADTAGILDKLAELPIVEWSYKGEATRHIGPTAEQFCERFGVGDGKTIHVADVCGVMLAAIAELAKRGA